MFAQQLQLKLDAWASPSLVPLLEFSMLGSESKLSDILSQIMSTRRSNTAWNAKIKVNFLLILSFDFRAFCAISILFKYFVKARDQTGITPVIGKSAIEFFLHYLAFQSEKVSSYNRSLHRKIIFLVCRLYLERPLTHDSLIWIFYLTHKLLIIRHYRYWRQYLNLNWDFVKVNRVR